MEFTLISQEFSEQTTKKIICDYYKLTNVEINKLIVENSDYGFFSIDEDLILFGDKKRAKSTKNKISVTNKVKSSRKLNTRSKYIFKLNGKEYNSNQFSEILNVNSKALKSKINGLKSATINGFDVEIEIGVRSQGKKIIKKVTNGEKVYTNVTYQELADNLKLKMETVRKFVSSGVLENRTGFWVVE